MKLIVTFKNKKDLEEIEAFQDNQGDYWPSEEYYNKWSIASISDCITNCLYKDNVGQTIDFYSYWAKEANISDYSWCISEETKNKYPEHFL